MIIVKIGGGKKINLQGIIADLAQVTEPFLIIHGAHALRDELALALNTPKEVLTSLSGYSSVFSTPELLDIMLMSYAGLRNKRIVELCHQHGINAIGLTGLDGKLIQGKRNKGIKVLENNKRKIKRDLSGKPQKINEQLLALLLDNGYVPVITMPIIDEQQVAINSENDDVVALLHHYFQTSTIIQLIEAPGLLKDVHDAGSLIKTLSKEQLPYLEQKVEARMKRKIHALGKLVQIGDPTIIISDGRVEHPIQQALAHIGTIIQ